MSLSQLRAVARHRRVRSALIASLPSLLIATQAWGASLHDFGQVAVGSSVNTAVTVPLNAAQQSARASVSLQFGIDFSIGTCTAVSGGCSAPLTFVPKYAGLREDIVVVKDSSGNVLQTALVQGTGSGPVMAFIPGTFSQIFYYANISPAIDQFGDIYFSPYSASVQKWHADGTAASVVAGNGNFSYTGDGGPATQASIYASALAVDGIGNVYIGDSMNSVIRKVDAVTGIITTIAGTGTRGNTGDGGPANSAEISVGTISADETGDLFLVDPQGLSIREIDTGSGHISTLLTSQTAGGSFGTVTPDNAGHLFIANTGLNQIQRLTLSGSSLAAVAGNGTAGFSGDGGLATSAELNAPRSVALSSGGNLYVADSGNYAIRMVDTGTGIIHTAAGNGSAPQNFSGITSGPATSGAISTPVYVAIAPDGDIVFAGFFQGIFRVSSNPGITDFGSVQLNSSQSRNVLISNIGIANFDIESIDLAGANTGGLAETNDCGTIIAPGSTCTANLTFAPSSITTAAASLLVSNGSQVPATETIAAIGRGTPQASFSSTSLQFAQSRGTTSAQNITLTNTGNDALHIQSWQLRSGYGYPPYGLSFDNCGYQSALAPGASCTVTVTFTPVTEGAFSDAIIINDDAPNSPQTINLSGASLPGPIVSLSGSGNLTSVSPGAAGPPTPFVLKNTGDAPLNISSIKIGPLFNPPSDFSQVSDCGSVLPAGQGCIIWVTYSTANSSYWYSSQASLVVTDNAPGSPHTQFLSGTLKGNSKPRLYVDSPAPGAALSGTVNIAGWALSDTNNVYNVSISVDGASVGYVNYGTARPDVCAAYPGRPGCPNVGWQYRLDTTLFADGPHQLVVSASSGMQTAISVPFTVSNAGAPQLTRLYIDQPNSLTGTLTGTANFAGWAIDDQAGIAYVSYSVDGTLSGAIAYGLARPDVCGVYPGRSGCPNVGWNASFDTSRLPDGKHILAVTATTYDGRHATISSSFISSNTAQSSVQAFIDSPSPDGFPVSGTITPLGWAIDANSAISYVSVSVDNASGWNYGGYYASYGLNRPDVCNVYPNRIGCPYVGWQSSIDTTSLADGVHKLIVSVTSTDGRNAVFTRQFTVANTVNLSAQRFDAFIDSPASGSTVSGVVSVVGWAIDELAPAADVEFKIDGVPAQNLIPAIARPDVCKAYAWATGCPSVGWASSIDTSLLADGKHTFEIIVSSVSGKRIRRSVTFTSANSANASNSGERVFIDGPSANSTVAGQIAIAGWAINRSTPVGAILVSVDGIALGNAQYGLPRPDVCAVFPGSTGCPNVGWTFTFDTRSLADGAHTIQVVEFAGSANAVATQKIVVANNSGGPAGIKAYVDSPSSNATYSGTAQFGGWAIDDTDSVSGVDASVDGIPVGSANYGTSRGDVCAAYPNRAGCPNVGWEVFVDTTEFDNGIHTFQITVHSSLGHESTISKTFTVSN